MEGFFDKKQTLSVSRPDGKSYTCASCGLYKYAQTPKMEPKGQGKKQILLIGDFPSREYNSYDGIWQGKAGSLLKKALQFHDIDINKDCWTINSINCRPQDKSDKKGFTSFEINCCRRIVIRAIDQLKPKLIIPLGIEAVESLIGHRWQKGLGTIHKWRDWQIPDQDFKAWICPVFHPTYVSHMEKNPEVEVIWKMDLEKAIAMLDTPFPNFDSMERKVTIVDQEIEITKLLKRILKSHRVAIDIETTGLKPHDTSIHDIVCIALAFSASESYVIERLNDLHLSILKRILKSSTISKVAQNMKFEHTWIYNIWNIEIVNWGFDTMLAAHVLNNQPGITGLKFQTYVNFGIVDYSSEVESYLKAGDSNSVNGIQKVMKNPATRKKIMVYCGLDSLFTFLLADIQINKLVEKYLYPAYQLKHDGILALAKAEQQGLRIDTEYIEKAQLRLDKKITRIQNQLNETNFIKKWKRHFPGNFNMNSDHQLGELLYKIMKLKPPNETVSGAGSTNEESLLQLNIPELDQIIQIRKYDKIKGTYLSNFMREQVNGVMHPNYNLHTVQTYRGSSNNPNFQNIPNRDVETMRLIRKSIYPRKGHQLMAFDFSGIEVRIAACYHKDPTMLKYIEDPTTDMHSDMAKQIFKITKFDSHLPEHKYLRSAAKNSFVFPQFYGDYFKGCAESLRKWIKLSKGKWRMDQGVLLPGACYISNHMIGKGINSFNAFENHIKEVENDFWNNRFKVYQKWKDKWLREYQKNGYFQMYTDFKCTGVMRKNEVINYPVQGAAFHCLLWSFIQVDKLIVELGMDTRLVGQIHDEMLLDVNPDEVEQITRLIHKVMTQDLPKKWNWINVPLEVDAEICPVDGSWAEKEEYKINI